MKKPVLKFEHGVFLFAAGASGTVFAIGNEDNSVSGSVGYFMLEGVESVELFAVKFRRFSVFEHKNISLYNVYIV